MKQLITLASILFLAMPAIADDSKIEGVHGNGNTNNVNVCKPTVIVKSCGNACCKKQQVRVVEKVIEKPVPVYAERVVEKTVTQTREVDRTRKNHVSLIGGYGARGNLVESTSNGVTETRTENGPVFGLQYLRDFGSGRTGPNALIQIQTNRTLSVGIGVSF